MYNLDGPVIAYKVLTITKNTNLEKEYVQAFEELITDALNTQWQHCNLELKVFTQGKRITINFDMSFKARQRKTVVKAFEDIKVFSSIYEMLIKEIEKIRGEQKGLIYAGLFVTEATPLKIPKK